MRISGVHLDRQELPAGHEYEVHHKTVPIPSKLYPVKRTRERVTFEPTSPVYGR